MNRIAKLPIWTAFVATLRDWVYAPAVPAIRAKRKPVGFVSLVGAGPGSADLITLRGMRVLQAANVVFYDRLADAALLDHVGAGARLVDVGKAPGNHTIPQDEICRMLVQAALQGLKVVRLKCGDPGVFGRGAEEASALDAAGVVWEIVPGVTAACAAAASARSFLTERGVSERVIFATGHRREGDSTDWAAAAAPGTTLACYMGVAGAGVMQRGLIAAGWPAGSAVEVISKAQTPQERLLSCPLSGLAALFQSVPGLNPAMLLIRWPQVALVPVTASLAAVGD